MQSLDIEIAGDRKTLVIRGENGLRRALEAKLMWAECPSAQGRVRRELGRHKAPPENLTIVSVREVGSYGINVVFSDGHDRGIYPWSYLVALAARPQLEDFLYD